MHDERTEDALADCDQGEWTVHGFFFYDRGMSSVQKSISGLFCEILYGVLQKNRQLTQYVLPTYHAEVKHNGRRPNDANPAQARHEPQWTSQNLRDAFAAICSQSTTPANILLFIDALDEHSEGEATASAAHNALLDILDDMTSPGNNVKTVSLKLCLVSRPQPVFTDRLQQHPGFVIHDHTWDDIDTYITQRFQRQLSGKTREVKGSSIKRIQKTLLKSAEGVFIWIQLAMDELIQAIQEGLSDKELEEISRELPPSLNHLYDRAIQRAIASCEGASARRKQRHSLEMHITFAIALSAATTDSWLFRRLDDFGKLVQEVASALIKASLSSQADPDKEHMYLQTARLASPEAVEFDFADWPMGHGGPSLWSQEPYVTSRSGGLLELSDAYFDEPPIVFIHQTAKEYAQSIVSKQSLFVNIDIDAAAISGIKMVLGYDLARLRVQCEGQTLAAPYLWKNVFSFANEMELECNQSIAPALLMLQHAFDPSLLTLTVALIMDDFGGNHRRFETFGRFEGHLNVTHLATAALLPLTLNDLITHQKKELPLSPAIITSLILCSMTSCVALQFGEPSKETEQSRLRVLRIALQQDSANKSEKRDVTFSFATAHWFFRSGWQRITVRTSDY